MNITIIFIIAISCDYNTARILYDKVDMHSGFIRYERPMSNLLCQQLTRTALIRQS